MPLFQLDDGVAKRLRPTALEREKELQKLCEANLESLLGVRFVASEFATGERHGGRIDTLGLDQNNCPVIIEYKLTGKENVINQGLFYLDWLLDHRGDFQVAVQRALGADVVPSWDYTRLILIAREYSKYDRHAVEQIGRGIELKSYRLYEGGLLYLEDVYSSPLPRPSRPGSDPSGADGTEGAEDAPRAQIEYGLEHHLDDKPSHLQELFAELREHLLSLGDDVAEKPTKLYVAYSTNRNFCEIEVQKKQLKLFLDIPYERLGDRENVRDVSQVGHWGTGNCQVIVRNDTELEKVKALIKESYDYFR